MGLLFTVFLWQGTQERKTGIELNIEYYQFNFIYVE